MFYFKQDAYVYGAVLGNSICFLVQVHTHTVFRIAAHQWLSKNEGKQISAVTLLKKEPHNYT